MSEFKGTPGPWVFCSDYGFVGSESAEAGPADIVCRRPDSWCYRSMEFWPANARLIAAAPDLLEMLRVVERYFDTEEPHPILQADISAAIAKATGAQP